MNLLTLISNFLQNYKNFRRVWRHKYFPICKLALIQNILHFISLRPVKYHSFISCGASQCWEFSYLVFDKISEMRFNKTRNANSVFWGKRSEMYEGRRQRISITFNWNLVYNLWIQTEISACVFFLFLFIHQWFICSEPNQRDIQTGIKGLTAILFRFSRQGSSREKFLTKTENGLFLIENDSPF